MFVHHGSLFAALEATRRGQDLGKAARGDTSPRGGEGIRSQ